MKLGGRKHQWTAEQIEAVKLRYEKEGSRKIAEEFELADRAVVHMAHKLGLTYGKDIWTEEREQVLRDRYSTDGPAALAKEFGMTSFAVTAKARRLGIGPTRKKSNNFRWTEEMIAEVEKRYVAEGADKLASEFGVTINTVRRQASRIGLHTISGHKRWGQVRAEANESLDIHFFDKWSPSMAYILGFLFADGSVTKSLGAIRIALAASDKVVLEFIKREFKAKNEIYEVEAYDHRYQPQVILLLSSTILVKKAIEIGLKPRKTFNDDPFPEVPTEMLPHFARGVMDGDGCICLSQNRRKKLQFCSLGYTGSVKFITALRDKLVRYSGMAEMPIQIRKGKTAVYCNVSWTALDDLRNFYKYVYANKEDFCLLRKRDILENWLSRNHRESRRPVAWTFEEEKLVSDLYKELGLGNLSELLNRDKATVALKVKELEIPLNTEQKPWTDNDIKMLIENYQSRGTKETAKVLQRKPWNVWRKAKELCLSTKVKVGPESGR